MRQRFWFVVASSEERSQKRSARRDEDDGQVFFRKEKVLKDPDQDIQDREMKDEYDEQTSLHIFLAEDEKVLVALEGRDHNFRYESQ
ncbi:MAG: hypothetical protein A3I05_09255 [Deltaproteobacteria bacterium RIFCSPLOWO2_02_FULL_44_10]|nr:MAG: hypothetical protein A3I05_09255 [Deltaproteobacteria bacterium RIFCSPLOWO2_02_FULL_44_10]